AAHPRSVGGKFWALGILFRSRVRKDATAVRKKAQRRSERTFGGDAREPAGRTPACTNHAFDKTSGSRAGHGNRSRRNAPRSLATEEPIGFGYCDFAVLRD